MLAKAIDTNELPTHISLSRERIVNALSERGIVQVEGADDDTCMVGL